MKLRKYSFIFLAIVLFLTSTISVEASPDQQDPQEALIRQVMIATAQNLGWSTSIMDGSGDDGAPGWTIYHAVNGDIFQTNIVQISAYNSEAAAKNALQNALLEEPVAPFAFHGYTAYSGSGTTGSNAVLQVDRFIFIVALMSGKDAKNYLEICYGNAVSLGLITGDLSVSPEITVTPELGTVINLKAYAEGYDEVTDAIDNSANFASIDISGKVTDLNTGAAIGGATITTTSGASGSTTSAADGSYSFTATVPNGQDSGSVNGVDFALPVKADIRVNVTPGNDELLADGISTSDITIQVTDLQGNPLKDRAFNLELSADLGPGTIHPTQAVTDGNGVIYATYTAFKADPGPVSGNARHEVVVTARDAATGVVGSSSIFLSQYSLSVQFGEYIPACVQCNFPSEFTISVSDYWMNPVANLPLTLRIEGGTGGTLVSDPGSNASQQEITLTTDGNGQATVYYKWQGSVDTTEAVQRVVILDEVTNAQETKEVKVHGLDIAIAKVEEAGFTGVTGQRAFLKIYFKEFAHPDLLLDRFNAASPNKLGLRVTIRQYHSDGVNTSLTYEQTGAWEKDEGGFFVKMYATPYMPYIIPVNDGNSWFEVRVDPVIDQDVFIPDLFRANNDNILVLRTGSPDGWLHIWLQDGVLTPHSWTGVLFKCVGRFLPFVGDAMTVIDTLNQVYKMDALGLGQSTATVITENLQTQSSSKVLTKFKASTINNVISCLQDIYAVNKEKNQQSSSSSGGVCAALILPLPRLNLSADDAAMISTYQDRFVQGMLLDTPEERGVVVYGFGAGNVTLRDAAGNVFTDADRMSNEGNVAVYILPANADFTLEISGDHSFEIGIYENGTSTSTRKTIRQEVQANASLTAKMAIGSSSDYTLELDKNNDGTIDTVQTPLIASIETEKPQITSFTPESGATVNGKTTIKASYADNPGGIGIDPQSVQISVNGINRTAEAEVRADSLTLTLSDLEAGEYIVRVGVSDLDGNGTLTEWTFTSKDGFSFSLNNPTLILAVGGGFVLLLMLGMIFAVSRFQKRRKRKVRSAGKDGTVQDAQGRWWYQDPNSGGWFIWNGESWQRATRPASRPPTSIPPAPKRIPMKKQRSGCLITFFISGLVALVVIGGISLVAFQFFPAYQLQIGQGDLTEILKMGGGGALVSVLGLLMLHGGLKAIITRRTIVEDDWGRKREKRGCSAVINGLGRLFFGILLLVGGLGMMTLTLYQEVLPWLGF